MSSKKEDGGIIKCILLGGLLGLILGAIASFVMAATSNDKMGLNLQAQNVVYEILDGEKSIKLSEKEMSNKLKYDYHNNEIDFLNDRPIYLRTIDNEPGYRNYNEFIENPVVLRRDLKNQLYIEIELNIYEKVDSKFDDGNWVRLDQAFNGNEKLDHFINMDIIRYKIGETFLSQDSSYFYDSVKLIGVGEHHMKVIVNPNYKKPEEIYEKILYLGQYPADTWKDAAQIFNGNEQFNNILNSEIIWSKEVFNKKMEFLLKPVKLIAVGKDHMKISYIEKNELVEKTIPFELYPQKYWKPINQIFTGNQKLDHLVGKDIIGSKMTKVSTLRYMSRPIKLHAVGKDCARISYIDPYDTSMTVEEIIDLTEYPEDIWVSYSEAFNGNPKLDHLLNKEILFYNELVTLSSVGNKHAKISIKQNEKVEEIIVLIDRYPEDMWVEFTEKFEGNIKLDHLVNRKIAFDLKGENRKILFDFKDENREMFFYFKNENENTYGPVLLLEVGKNYMKVLNEESEISEEILSLDEYPAEGWYSIK